MVADAPPFESIAREVLERLQGRQFVAHNARFDYGFLRGELRRAGHPFSAPLICTVRLSRLLYPDAGRHNLDSLIERHGLDCASRHRALPDAQVLAQFWQVLRNAWPVATLDAALERVARRPVLPAHLPPELIDDLPEAPGVYRFYGAADALIYVGKANNLRERVLTHFAGATRDAKSQRLAAQTLRVEWHETAGELGALLLEARLVRELQPVYNRRLRGSSENWTWVLPDDGSAPQLVDLDAHPLGSVDAFGLYRSARQARTALTRLARDAKLCLRVLGLETGGEGSCFGYQIGRCAGACVGVEPRARHGIRAKLALAALKLKSWPYDGAVGVEERSALGLAQLHVIDRWQYLGTLTEGTEQLRFERAPGFDVDAYRILTRFLKPGLRSLRPLPQALRQLADGA
jgi:DNA polymerase-3 subunit epsilon